MEFLDYTPTVQALRALGVCERKEGPLTRFEIRPSPKVAAEVHCLCIGPKDALASAGDHAGNGARRIETRADGLPAFAESVIHRIHISEVVLIPVGTWGALLNAALMDLVSDESWLGVDAEASLHQKGRDPLAVNQGEAHIVKAITAALLKNGEAPDQDLTIAATGSPLLIEVARPGYIRVWCPNGAVAQSIAELAGGKTKHQ